MDEEPKDDEDLLNGDDPQRPGEYNMESIIMGKRTLSMRRPIPVFGMKHASHQGADPHHVVPGPRSKKLTESEARELILRHALDTQGYIAELKRMFDIGAIDMLPDNIKKLVDAEKGNAEVILRALDTTGKLGGFGNQGGDNKTIALQIINNVTQVIDRGFDKARENMDRNKTIEASVEAVEIVKRHAEEIPLLPEPKPQPNLFDTDDIEQFARIQRGA